MNKIFIVILLKEVTAVLHKRASSEYVHPLSGELLPRQRVHIFMGGYSPDNGCTYSWGVTPQAMGAHIHGELLPRQWVLIFMGSYSPDNGCTLFTTYIKWTV